MGIVLKRAKYFITCNNKYFTDGALFKKSFIESNLVLEDLSNKEKDFEQLSLLI